jgi:hypothetical protein
MPWRVTRAGVVVSVPDGTLVVRGLAVDVLVLLPATLPELAAALPDVGLDDLTAALAHLASRGWVLEGGT